MTTGNVGSAPYWRTRVSEISDDSVYIRGYRLDDLIGLSFTPVTYLVVKGELPTPSQARVLDAVLTAVLDYGLEKPGTAAARFVVSSNPSMQAGLATAVLAAGEYSLAPDATVRFVQDLQADFAASGGGDVAAFATAVVDRLRADRQRIPGLGHPLFKRIDPRAEVLKRIAVEEGLWGEAGDLYEAVHRAFTALPGKGDIPINDVGMIGVLCVCLGLSPDEATALTVLGTLPGVIAHICEERATGRKIRALHARDVDYPSERRDAVADLAATGWGPTAEAAQRAQRTGHAHSGA